MYKKMSAFVVFLVAFLNVNPVLGNLTCLSCIGIFQPRHCHSVADCTKDEVCGVESVTLNGQILYNLGCRRREQCHSFSNGTSTQSHVSHSCAECCEHTLCNAAGCGQIGYPTVRGPMCYNCPLTDDHRKCHGITSCATDEECYIESKEEFSDIIYSSGCKLKQNCGTGDIHSPIIGRRRRGERRDITGGHGGLPTCSNCCTDDLCNRQCGIQIPSDCGPITSFANGIIEYTSNSTVFGANALFKCMPGYEVVGTTTATCSSDGRWNYTQPPACRFQDTDCYDIHTHHPNAPTGVYQVNVSGSGTKQSLSVYCDMTTDGGGWTVFQRRFNGSVDFYRNFSQYKTGFGNVHGEFWLGLDWIHWMTSNGSTYNELRVDVTTVHGTSLYDKYGEFTVDSEPYYNLHFSSHTGTAGDKLTEHNRMPFSTFDRDNDNSGNGNCALLYHGAFWYNDCYSANLNGNFGNNFNNQRFSEMDYDNGSRSVSKSKMMFRRK